MNVRAGTLRANVGETRTQYLYYWLIVALFFEYARPASYLPFLRIPLLYSLIPLSLLVVSMFAIGMRSMQEVLADRLSKWVFIFLGLIVTSAIHADVTSYVYETFKTVLGYVFLFILIVRITTTLERLKGIIVTLVVAHLFLLAMNPAVVLEPSSRHYVLGASFLGDGNDFSLSLCLLIPCLVAVTLEAESGWKKLLGWASVSVLLLAIVGTQSRGATIGIGAVLLYLWLRTPRKVLGLVGVAVVGIAVLLYAPPAYFQRMNSISTYQQDGSAQGRIEAWKSSINMAADSPLLGVGAGHFPTAFGTKYRTPGAANMPWLTAHSSYFLVLGELGLPGLVCILMLVIGNVRANSRLGRQIVEKAGQSAIPGASDLTRLLMFMSAAAVGLGVSGAFLSAAYYPHFYVLTGLMVSVRCIVAKEAGIAMLVANRPVVRRSRAVKPNA